MEILLVAGAIAGLLGFRFWQGLRNHHHEWVAVHNGKRLHLVVSGSSCVLKVDGQPALEAAVDNKITPLLMTGGLRFRPSFRYAIAEDCAPLGAVVRLQSKDWITHKSPGRRHFHSPEVFLSIGDEVVPLVELAGAGQDTSTVFAELEVAPVSDTRWHSVQSVLERIRSAAGGTDSVVAATQQLSEQLRSLFAMAAELTSADAETLWTDAGQLQQLRQSVETDIELCLAAVQQLHQLSLERRQAALSDSDLSSVHRAVHTLKAEIEAGQQDSDARRKLMQRLAQRQRS